MRKTSKKTRQGNGRHSYWPSHKFGKSFRKRGKKYRGQGKAR